MTETTVVPQSGAYRAVWRWHFYAGLLVMPFLMLMALTGGIYLFKDEIDAALWRDMARVEARADRASPDRWVAAAQVAGGGEARSVRIPARPDEAVRVVVNRPDGQGRIVFVDPHDAQVTGVTAQNGVSKTVKRLHSLDLFGPLMNLWVEVVAGWAIILFATGIFLWWPRGRKVGTVTIRSKPGSGRPFWRDLHAVTGLYTGVIVVFLAMTGMLWSAVWGDQFMGAVRTHGLGRPPAPAAANWHHAEHADRPVGTGWLMDGMVTTTAPSEDGRLSRVVATARREGVIAPFVVSIPASDDLAWTAAREVRRVEDGRSLYVDAATGTVRADVRYEQFGIGAKVFEWSIYAHQGTQYGQINRIVMLAACIGIWLLSISGLMMWWKRRPKGRLAAPVAPPGPRVRAAVLGIVIPLCILYPLTGLSLAVAVLLDRTVGAIRRRATAH
ncbi:PepSY domain-containing protein [Brevundimonas vitis]|uniref:PepSY domain-containing protein n=1 Tax=Brevundimonas vitisensis TaxID=2800818 RepID=A0ABX7BNJ4_9CAUL|nr:PepSY domain-containing protein [Brevundimonas vitisensis]QQQ19163.1 PepSY domain-containing protein [Brevundimonas vitisensis]